MAPASPPIDIDALRRRLYLPGATEEEVARYRRAVEATSAGLVAGAAGAPEPPPRATSIGDRATVSRSRRLRRVLGIGTAAAVTLVVAVGIALPRPTPQQAATPPPLRAESLPVSIPQRSEFVRTLRAGLRANLRWFLYEHPAARPTALNGVTRVDSAEYAHTGTGSVELDPSSLAARGGHVTLIVMTGRGGDGRWLLDRQALREDSRGLRQVIAASSFGAAAGAPLSWTAAYISAPMRLTVAVPAGVNWDAVVVFTD